MRRRTASIVWALVVVDVLGFGGVQVLAREASLVQPWLLAELLLMTALFGGVGALIVTRTAKNTVGWLLLLFSTLVAANLSSLAYSAFSARDYAGTLPGTMAALWFAAWTFVPGLTAALLFLPLLFPDGRLPGKRWRWVAAMFGLITVLTALPDLLRPGPFFGGSGVPGASALADNPTGVPGAGGFLDAVSQLDGILTLVAALLAVAAMIQRYRRGTLVQRQQLKWFGASVVVAIAALFVAAAVPGTFGTGAFAVAMLGLVFLPVGIGIAVLRYRLYEIDRIISRTLAYAILTAILAGVYLAGFLGLQAILASFMTNGGSLAVAASTLVVFALFQPIRRRIQGIVDRGFNRSRYDAAREIDSFASRVRNEVEVDRLTAALATTLERTMQPASASIWLRDR